MLPKFEVPYFWSYQIGNKNLFPNFHCLMGVGHTWSDWLGEADHRGRVVESPWVRRCGYNTTISGIVVENCNLARGECGGKSGAVAARANSIDSIRQTPTGVNIERLEGSCGYFVYGTEVQKLNEGSGGAT